jgi:hypothetical protein
MKLDDDIMSLSACHGGPAGVHYDKEQRLMPGLKDGVVTHVCHG